MQSVAKSILTCVKGLFYKGLNKPLPSAGPNNNTTTIGLFKVMGTEVVCSHWGNRASATAQNSQYTMGANK